MSKFPIMKLLCISEGRCENEDQRERESTLETEGWLCMASGTGGMGWQFIRWHFKFKVIIFIVV